MPNDEEPVETGPVYSAKAVRGAEINLKGRWQRIMFFGGLAAMTVFVLFVTVLVAR